MKLSEEMRVIGGYPAEATVQAWTSQVEKLEDTLAEISVIATTHPCRADIVTLGVIDSLARRALG